MAYQSPPVWVQTWLFNLALVHLTDKIKQVIDRGLIVGAIFIDLAKPFDTLNHCILSNKLERFGITHAPLELLRCYLLNRSVAVCPNDHYSANKLVISGIPQGYLLGPLLFLLFIYDSPNLLTDSECLLYDGDTTLYSSQHTLVDLQATLHTDLSNAHRWRTLNRLRVNPVKTAFVLFHIVQQK